MRALRHIPILLIGLVAASGCHAQPHEQFRHKKYRLRTSAAPGTPSVVQRYYAKHWPWRRHHHKVQHR